MLPKHKNKIKLIKHFLLAEDGCKGSHFVLHCQIHRPHPQNKVQTWSMVKRTPVAAMSWCQCRLRMAGFWSSATARRETRRFFTLPSRPVKASHARTCQRHRPGISAGGFWQRQGGLFPLPLKISFNFYVCRRSSDTLVV